VVPDILFFYRCNEIYTTTINVGRLCFLLEAELLAYFSHDVTKAVVVKYSGKVQHLDIGVKSELHLGYKVDSGT